MEVKNYNNNLISSTASKATNVERPTSRSPAKKTPQSNSYKRVVKDTSSGRKMKTMSPFSETEDSEFSDVRKYRKFKNPMAHHLNKQTHHQIVPMPIEEEEPRVSFSHKKGQQDYRQGSLGDSLGSTTNVINRLKESNLKLSKQNDRAEEEIERCHDQIARLASQNHQL